MSADDIVPFKHGENSSYFLSSAGFRYLTFKTYEGYLEIVTISTRLSFIALGFTLSHHKYVLRGLVSLCRLGHYTVPKEMEEVCHWLHSMLGLKGSR